MKKSNSNSIKEKIVVVTGSNSGIGYETAMKLAKEGNKVILACRNPESGENAVKNIGKKTVFMELDVSSIKSIDKFIENFQDRYPRLDILINNAGVMLHPPQKTEDGTEVTFAINYLGYFYLSLKLIPSLIKGINSKIVNVSSISSYHLNGIDWEYFDPQQKLSSLKKKIKIYEHTNLFRLMFSIELDKKLKEMDAPIKSIACHPGVAKSNLGRYSLLAKIAYTIGIGMASAKEGARPIIYAATDSNLKGGEFIGLDTKNQHKGFPKVVEPNPIANNSKTRSMLWKKTTAKCGIDLKNLKSLNLKY